MKKLIQNRSYLDNCTFSKVTHNGSFLFYTVERPWLNNVPWDRETDIASCVPAGLYTLIPISTPNHRNSFYLENENLGVSLNGNTVRTACLYHIANFPKEVRGCVGPGLHLHPEVWGVSQSRDAMNLLHNLIGSDRDWEVEIV